MADYLLPEANVNISDKLEIFALRTEMNSNPYNFGMKWDAWKPKPINIYSIVKI